MTIHSDDIQTAIDELQAFRTAFFAKHVDVLNAGNAGASLDNGLTEALDDLNDDLLRSDRETAFDRAEYAAEMRRDMIAEGW